MTDETIFATALEIAGPAERAAFLAEACGDDAARRQRLEGLLLAHVRAADFLERPAVASPDAAPGTTEALNGTPGPFEAATQTAGGESSASDDEAPTFLAPPTRPDSLGRIGHYEVLQVLGRGGFGIVFRAFDEVLQRVVALKVMAPQLAATSPARKRFLREARSSAQVRHENVVQVYEVAEQPLPYLAMELIPGETLQQRLNRVGPLDVPEVLRIGRQISEGLAAAHAMDLIHRDIKPGNVLLEGGQQKVKITDFGLARAADDASISQSGIIAGTPMYMAPEQAKGEKLDQRADLFSLGSVLYQMVTGRPPFRANGTLAVLKRVAEDQPRAIREIIPEAPQWLCDIIAKLHAKGPDDRYQSAREVADVLADCEAQLKANARLKDYSRIPRSKPRRPRRRMWVAAAAAVLLPALALVVTEFAGVTHLFLPPQATPGTDQSGSDPQAKARPGWSGPADGPPPVVAPFGAARARARQEAWAKYLGVPGEFTNSIGMKFMIIPPGRFAMGSSQEEIDRCLKLAVNEWEKGCLCSEGPRHEVQLTQPFYMGKTEVTVGKFRQFVEEKGYPVGDDRWQKPGWEQTDNHPAVYVGWQNAVDFCLWLSQKEGKEYRLPTEAEWEYSCRAGTRARYSFGESEDDLLRHAWITTNSQAKAKPVMRLAPNAWGLHDMHGNVWEWCQDVYDPNYYSRGPQQDPPGPGSGHERMFRGGSWRDSVVNCRSAARHHWAPGHRDHNIGFRVLLVVSPSASVRTERGAKDKPASAATAPLTDADVQRIVALPAAEQVEEVRKELMRRNPGFDGKVEHKIEDGVVTELKIVTDQVTDIAPIRVFNALRVLDCHGTIPNNGQLADLTPLEGMNLAGLTHLDLRETKVTDLTPLRGMALEDIRLSPKKITRGLDILRDMKSLKTIGIAWDQSWPAAEFWERYDKGEFKE